MPDLHPGLRDDTPSRTMHDKIIDKPEKQEHMLTNLKTASSIKAPFTPVR
jgi:hypothetical protein